MPPARQSSTFPRVVDPGLVPERISPPHWGDQQRQESPRGKILGLEVVMVTAAPTNRMALWERYEQEKTTLETLLMARKEICGCSRCADETRFSELAYRIRASRKLIDSLTDRMTDG